MDKIIHNVQFLDHTTNAMQRLAFDKISQRLAVVRSDNSIELWSCQDQLFRQKTIPGSKSGSIECVTWCQGRLFTGSLDGSITEHCLQYEGWSSPRTVTITGGACWCISTSHDQTSLVAGSELGHVILYSVLKDCLFYEKSLTQVPDRVMALSWLENGSHITIASKANIYSYCIDTSEVSTIRVGKHQNLDKAPRKDKTSLTIWSLLVLPDFTIAAGDSRGMITFWCGKTLTQINSVTSHSGAVMALTATEDYTTIYASGADPTIRQLICNNGRWCNSHKIEGHTHDVTSLAVDTTGRLLSGGMDRMLGVFSFPPKCSYQLSPRPVPERLSVAGNGLLWCGTSHLEWWRLGEHDTKHSSNGAQRIKQARTLIGRIECSETDSIVCCSLSPSTNVAAYCTEKHGIRLKRLHKPQGRDELQIIKVNIESSLSNGIVCGPLSKSPIRKLQWLNEEKFVAIARDNQVQVWTVNESCGRPYAVLSSTATTTEQLMGPTDGDVLHLHSSQCGLLIAIATSTCCIVHNLNTRRFTCMPSQSSPITAICVRSDSQSSSGLSSAIAGTVVVAYSDLRLREYDVVTGSITQFGERSSSALAAESNRHVVQNISWDDNNVICLQDDTRMVFIRKQSVLSYNWKGIPKTKYRKRSVNEEYKAEDAIKRRIVNGISTPSKEMINGNIDISELYVNKKTRVRHFNTKLNPLAEVWSKLSCVVSRTNSTIVLGQQLPGDAIVCVELPYDAVKATLPPTLDIARIGSK